MEKKFEMKEVLTMWLKKNDKGTHYLSGKTPDGLRLVGFFNGKKKNPKEPDVRIYEVDKDGNMKKEELTSLWVNISKNDKKYLSGKIGDMKVVGFIRKDAEPNGKKPYFSVYESESTPAPKEEACPEPQEQTGVPF